VIYGEVVFPECDEVQIQKKLWLDFEIFVSKCIQKVELEGDAHKKSE
jgi:hypothetical protein